MFCIFLNQFNAKFQQAKKEPLENFFVSGKFIACILRNLADHKCLVSVGGRREKRRIREKEKKKGIDDEGCMHRKGTTSSTVSSIFAQKRKIE